MEVSSVRTVPHKGTRGRFTMGATLLSVSYIISACPVSHSAPLSFGRTRQVTSQPGVPPDNRMLFSPGPGSIEE